ncbi:hypothetical protein [Pseudoalteromonas arabiensis]|uniref:hypothetical protein n=1 Tax=Pseudoalteromonas arabiensis TaxID=874454 RepID=UPI000783B5C7|nr:hypothetical protein [Pseudoalteromonas arabiensis]
MGLANKANFMMIAALMLSGCSLLEPKPVTEQTQQVVNKKHVTPEEGEPNPKPRPKSEPMYPPANIVIAWHAQQCGGYKNTHKKVSYVGEKEIKALFKSLCLESEANPEKTLALLDKTDQAYYWPDDIKQYFWLQKQSVKQHLKAKQAKQALTEKMEKTLSSLATIEQQLLLREETKEQ